MPFSYTNFQKISLPWEGENPLPHPPPSRSLRSLALAPIDRPGCTTVTGIAKMHKGPWSPLIGVKEIFKRGNIYGIGTYATSHNYPLIMSFSVEENAVFIHKFSKNLPTVGGGTPPLPHPPPLARSARSGSVASLPRILPPPLR